MTSRTGARQAIRMAAFPLGFGVGTVLVSGTLNRVMIVELGLPAALVGLFFAVTLLIAPVRVWLGYMSDAYPIAGRRREPYIMLGTLVGAAGVLGATLIITNTAAAGPVLVAGTLLAFAAYGMGSNLVSNTFEALLADTFEGDQRPRAVTIFKVVMFAGILGGAVVLGSLLEPFNRARFAAIVAGTMAGITLLSALAVVGQEPRTYITRAASHEAAAVPFWAAMQAVFWANPQARRFFVLVVLAVLGTLAQDVLLEPYGRWCWI
jgi:BCD family chlorophyll transporter-like MFS transporter